MNFQSFQKLMSDSKHCPTKPPAWHRDNPPTPLRSPALRAGAHLPSHSLRSGTLRSGVRCQGVSGTLRSGTARAGVMQRTGMGGGRLKLPRPSAAFSELFRGLRLDVAPLLKYVSTIKHEIC
jgi:hypothetical protein